MQHKTRKNAVVKIFQVYHLKNYNYNGIKTQAPSRKDNNCNEVDSTDTNIISYYVGPFHHSMVCPWVVDGGDGLQIWRVSADVLNEQLQTASKGWSSILGIG
jgi:hypothetical protein